eukprot:1153083-Pelagomonas_calceolata.AAC.1
MEVFIGCFQVLGLRHSRYPFAYRHTTRRIEAPHFLSCLPAFGTRSSGTDHVELSCLHGKVTTEDCVPGMYQHHDSPYFENIPLPTMCPAIALLGGS